MLRSLLCAAFGLGLVTPALAADIVVQEAVPVPEAVEYRDIIIDIGLGAQIQPEFPASEDYEISPWPIFDLQFLRLPIFGEVVDGQPSAVSIYPSLNFEGERDEDDADYLEGTDDVDFAFEAGAGIALQAGFVRGFVEGRYGFTGHNGIVVDAGLDVIVRPFERLELSAGPRVSLASDDYMDEYFGVGAGAVFLPAYDPDGGFKDVGAEAQAVYAFTDNLRLHAKAEWAHYVGDALDSPIVEEGNENEFIFGLGLSYRFGVDLY